MSKRVKAKGEDNKALCGHRSIAESVGMMATEGF